MGGGGSLLHVCALHGLKFISASRNELLGNKGLDRRRPISFPHTAEKKGWLAWCEELGSFLTTLQSDPLTAGREAHKNCRDLELTGRRVADVTRVRAPVVQGKGASWVHSGLYGGSLDHCGSDP